MYLGMTYVSSIVWAEKEVHKSSMGMVMGIFYIKKKKSNTWDSGWGVLG